MNNNQREDAAITEAIMQLIQSKKPRNVQQLIDMFKENTSIPERKIIEHIVRLQSQGKLTLRESLKPVPQKLSIYIRTKEAYWYWITLILAATTTITVYYIPENVYPIVYIRYIFVIIFLFWLPGYSFSKTLFPKELPLKTSSESLDAIERLALSVGMSIALVSIIGLLLHYTPWGIHLTPTVLSLLALTGIFATAGIIREHQSHARVQEAS